MTTTEQDVIYKLVLLDPAGETFEVPAGATLVSVGADPGGRGPAVWFRRPTPGAQDEPDAPTITWTLGFRGTGHAFPANATVLGTVLADVFAFHVLDLTGQVTR